ncbi:MAG: hypothetical protein U5L08_13725 [Xanthomonadales bacterium]|nr:hypothetical protein [Xanthomonadales bacterium]
MKIDWVLNNSGSLKRWVAAAASVFVIIATAPHVAFGQDECGSGTGAWPTSDWAVVCAADVIAELDHIDNLTESGISSELVCSGSREDSPSALARKVLVDTGAWFESMCFREPVVPTYRRGDQERAWKASLARADTDGNAGVYGDGELYVSYDYFIGDGIESGEGLDFKPSDDGLATLPHELFHAIQANYSLLETDDWHKWIIEGTAEAAELTWKRREDMTTLGQARYYDDPLHLPRNELHAYRTSTFWLWLGRELGSEPEIAYLHEMFQVGDFVAGYGLDDLEDFLYDRSTRLYDIYPAFIADRVTSTEMYANGDRSVTIAYREPESKKQHRGRVAAVAADPVTVKVDVPPNESGELEIKLRDDDPDLHLIVGNQVYSGIDPLGGMPEDQRMLMPEFRDPQWQSERNRFVTPVGGARAPSEFFVRVANVKREANSADAKPKRYLLDIKLTPIGECQFSAALSGDTDKTAARGEIAHFSTGGGATIQGLMTNPDNIDGMTGFLESMSGGRMSDEEKKQLAEQAEAWKAEAAKMPRETLGLSLTEMNLEGESEAMLASAIGGFRLGASVFNQPIEPGFTGGLEPGHIVVHTGEYTEDASTPIRYEWAPGAAGNASLEINQYKENLLTGTLSATLEGQGVYQEKTGEAPVITVTATFRALPHNPLRGDLGCIARE